MPWNSRGIKMKFDIKNYRLKFPWFGIDVSLWQRNIHFESALESGVKFCIIKSSEGEKIVDPYFHQHHYNATKYNIHVGAYHYFTGLTKTDAEKQMKHFIKTISKYKFDMPVFVDIEHNNLLQFSRDYITDLALYCVELLNDAGYVAGLYFPNYVLTYNINHDKIKSQILWIADINSKCPNIDGLSMWQFGGNCNELRSLIIGGVICDQNLCFVNFPQLIGDIMDFSKFPGNDNVPAEWARDSVKWAIENGLINGDENGLRLRDHLTREELCAILQRYDARKE